MPTSRKTFTAQFDGFCRYCDQPIYEGDDVAYLDDRLACEECWNEG